MCPGEYLVLHDTPRTEELLLVVMSGSGVTCVCADVPTAACGPAAVSAGHDVLCLQLSSGTRTQVRDTSRRLQAVRDRDAAPPSCSSVPQSYDPRTLYVWCSCLALYDWAGQGRATRHKPHSQQTHDSS